MSITKILDVFDFCIRSIQSMRKIDAILKSAKSDVYLEDHACYYLDRIEEELKQCNLI